ncbi:hypothetical protein V6N13_056862 [Hibiscus sabdariffa]
MEELWFVSSRLGGWLVALCGCRFLPPSSVTLSPPVMMRLIAHLCIEILFGGCLSAALVCSFRLAQVVHLHDCLAVVACLILRFAWIVTVGFAACPVAWLFVDEWLLGAASVAAAGTSFSCCSSFHPPWRESLLLVLWFTCPRSTTGLLAGSVYGADLPARPFRWPILGVGFAACPVAWPLVVERLLGAAPVVAAGTSFSCCSSFHPPWRASLLLVLWFTCPHSTTGLLAGSVCGTDLTARPFRWLILGVGFVACPDAWLLVA